MAFYIFILINFMMYVKGRDLNPIYQDVSLDSLHIEKGMMMAC